MGKMSLLVAMVFWCGLAACSPPGSKATAYASAADYYGPSAASYAPDFLARRH